MSVVWRIAFRNLQYHHRYQHGKQGHANTSYGDCIGTHGHYHSRTDDCRGRQKAVYQPLAGGLSGTGPVHSAGLCAVCAVT